MKAVKFILALCMTGAFITSCGSQKAATTGDVAVVVPCSGVEYQSSDDFLRASASGISTNMNVAKKKAMMSARTAIANDIESMMRSVSENYVNSYTSGEKDETNQRFNELTRQTVKKTLRGTRIVCDKLMKSPDGTYKQYVCLEMPAQSLLDDAAQALQNDKKLRVDFEYEKFKKVFNEELENHKNNQ